VSCPYGPRSTGADKSLDSLPAGNRTPSAVDPAPNYTLAVTNIRLHPAGRHAVKAGRIEPFHDLTVSTRHTVHVNYDFTIDPGTGDKPTAARNFNIPAADLKESRIYRY